MPRWASRLTLEVTEVGVERVQDISEVDARDEGITGGWQMDPDTYPGPIAEFRSLWDETNAHRLKEYGWTANPWVWVIRFRVLHPRKQSHHEAIRAYEFGLGMDKSPEYRA